MSPSSSAESSALRPRLRFPSVAPRCASSSANHVWAGTARATMYTCVELGGCNRTASGVWPYEGVVAVDPRLIPLGTSVWIEGLGTFLAADTGSAIRGAAVDVYVTDYRRAINWGIRHLPVVAFVPGEGKPRR